MENKIVELIESRSYPDLLKLLQKKNSKILEELSKVDESAISEILELISGANAWVKQNIICSIGESGNKGAFSYLLPFLEDEDEDVRFQTCGALEDIGDERAFEPLMNRCLHDESQKVRYAATSGLNKINGKKAIDLFTATYKDSSLLESIRNHATEALIRMGYDFNNSNVLDYIIHSFEQGDKSNIYLIKNIVKIVSPDYPYLTINHIPNILQEKKGEIDAVKSINYARDKGDIEALATMLDSTGSSHIKIRVILALSEIGTQKAVEYIIDALEEDDDYIRKFAIMELGDIGNSYATEKLVRAMLEDKDGGVRSHAISALKKIHGKQSIDYILPAIEDQEYIVRDSVIDALGDIGTSRAANILLDLFGKEDYSELDTSIATNLGKVRDPNIAKKLLWKCFQRKDTKLLSLVIYVIDSLRENGIIDGPLEIDKKILQWLSENNEFFLLAWIWGDGIKMFINKIHDENAKIRHAAAEAINYIRDESFVDDLIDIALDGKYGYIRLPAANALMEINNKKAQIGLEKLCRIHSDIKYLRERKEKERYERNKRNLE